MLGDKTAYVAAISFGLIFVSVIFYVMVWVKLKWDMRKNKDNGGIQSRQTIFHSLMIIMFIQVCGWCISNLAFVFIYLLITDPFTQWFLAALFNCFVCIAASTDPFSDPKCKPEWIITNVAQDLEAPLNADNYNNFPDFKKYISKPVPKYKLINPLMGIPKKFRDMLPPGIGKKLSSADIEAMRKNCPGDTCKQDTDEHLHNRAVLADYEVAMLQRA
uniref:G_PROTEIN_RECEP_F1_2 domain-containing protein n=1 Tax=Meloidogyne hapla TaxID=6305 RepID=A0A1I8C0Y9_MELHA